MSLLHARNPQPLKKKKKLYGSRCLHVGSLEQDLQREYDFGLYRTTINPTLYEAQLIKS